MISLLALAFASLSDEPDLIIRNANVIDVDAGTHAPAHVAIDDGKIVSVGSEMPTAGADTQILEAGGRYLIPGLWDAHVHSVTNWAWHAPAFLAHGVTSVRNLHTSEPEGYAKIKAIKAQGERGEAPRMIANGFIVGGEESQWGNMIKVLDADDARAAVDAHIENGMDLIKIYHSLGTDEFLALAAYADEKGIPVDGHIAMNVRTPMAIEAGQRTIEHGIAMVHGCVDWDKADRLAEATERPDVPGPKGPLEFAIMRRAEIFARDEAQCTEVAEMMAENGTVAVPTVVNAMTRRAVEAMQTVGQETSLPASLYGQWMQMAESPLARAITDLNDLSLETEGKDIGYFRSAGTTILAGTDVGNEFLAPGASLLRELEYFEQLGMTPREALATATTNPARVFELDGLGCIAAGCVADLVLLDHDPLATISNVRAIAGVVHAGTYKPKGELDAALAAALAKENAKAQ